MKKFISAVRKMRNNPGIEVAIVYSPIIREYFTISKQRYIEAVENIDPNFMSFAESGDELLWKNFEYPIKGE